MEFNVGNAQHIGARPQQEDSFAFSDPGDRDALGHGGFLGIVADGMGGLSNGQQASATAVQTFLLAYRAKSAAEPIADALRRSLIDANRAVMELQATPSSRESGTTLAAVVVTEEHLHWIAAGDSRIYWLRNNQLTRLTADHVYATRLDRQVAAGTLSREAAQRDPQRGSLTSYLGQPGPALIDYNLKPVTLHQGEIIILCSDGFYRAVSEEEIVAHFKADPQTACDRLVELVLAKQRSQQDNLTVIAFRAKAGKSRLARLRKAVLVAVVPLVLALAAGAYWLRSRSVLATPPAAVAAPPGKAPQSQPQPLPDQPITVSIPTAAPSQVSSGQDQASPKATASTARPKIAAHGHHAQPQSPSPAPTAAPSIAAPSIAAPAAHDTPPVAAPAVVPAPAPATPPVQEPPSAKPPEESTPPPPQAHGAIGIDVHALSSALVEG